MPITVETVCEGGVLKPVGPLPLKEHERVEVAVRPKASWVEETYGLLGWSGGPEELRRLALHPELDLEEGPGPSPT
ncbi:MAG TPA: antitoxin family protein [Gemmataceae bacterium]|nr:antitoxin family protein [Gemmataceae bacterium]